MQIKLGCLMDSEPIKKALLLLKYFRSRMAEVSVCVQTLVCRFVLCSSRGFLVFVRLCVFTGVSVSMCPCVCVFKWSGLCVDFGTLQHSNRS